MQKITLILIVLTFILAGCAGQATPQQTSAPVLTEEAIPTPEAVEPSTTPAAQEAVEPTPITATTAPEQSANPAGLLVYKIIPGESSVTYEVGETFFNENNRFFVAVGRTPQIRGEVSVDTNNPQNSQIGMLEIDISQFTSDSSRRDNAIRGRFLESGRYPIATFNPSAIEGLPSSYSAGEELTFQVTGDLTVRQVTQPVTFDVTAKVEGDTLTGSATTTILMSQFGVGPITLAGILGTEDEVALTFNFVARP